MRSQFVQLALVAVALLGLAPIPAAPAQPATSIPPTAYSEVASCFNARGQLAVLALVDESGSLQKTDSDNRRVDALISMLHTLARYGSNGEGSSTRKIEIQLAGFGTEFHPGRWQELNESTRGSLEDEARSYAKKNTRADTDFAAALLGAQGEFARKDAVSGERQPCRLLLLFTDGIYELETKGTKRPYASDVSTSDLSAIVDRGTHFLCDPGQLADQLRAAGTVLVAIGLIADRSRDQTFLQSIAERDAPGRRCGDSNAPPGKHVAVTGLGELLTAFDSAIAQALGGTPTPSGPDLRVCSPSAPADAQCTRRFELDRSLREFHMLLNLGAPGIIVELTPPRGNSLRLDPGQRGNFTVASAELAVSALTELDMIVDGRLPAGATDWVGTWTVRFIDADGKNQGAVARSQITVFGGLKPVTVPEPPAFHAGERTEFRIRVIDAASSPRTPSDFVRSARITASIIDSQGRTTDIPVGQAARDGAYPASFTVPADFASSFVDLKVTLDVVTTGGLRLQPRSTTYRIQVKQASAYPVISPTELRLSPILSNDGTASGTLTVTGGPGGSGCAWFATAFGQLPPATGALTTRYTPDATSGQRCVRVAAGQSTTVRIEIRPEEVRTGLAKGELTVALSADREPDRKLVMPVRFEMQRQPSEVTRWVLFTVMIGGVLLPLCLLWLVSWATARFLSPGQLRCAQYDVVITENEVLDATTHRPINATYGAMPDTVPSGQCRRFELDALTFGRRIPLLPWLLPYGRVRAADSFVLSGSSGGRRFAWARVSFDLNQTWVLTLPRTAAESQSEEIRGRLYLFVTDVNVPEKSVRLMADVATDVPNRVRVAGDRIRVQTEPEPVAPMDFHAPM